MQVTDIAPRRKGYSAVTLSPPPPLGICGGEYEGERLLIDKVILTRLHIKRGSELSIEDLEQLVYVSECYRAKQRAIWHLKGKDYSEKNLYDKLRRSFSDRAAAFAMSQMVQKGFLDDERYATRLIAKLKEKNLSRRECEAKLYLKGVPKEILARLLEEEHLSLSDSDRALSLIKNKYLNKIKDEDGRRRTVQALQRRGFSYSDIKKALDSILGDIQSEEIC